LVGVTVLWIAFRKHGVVSSFGDGIYRATTAPLGIALYVTGVGLVIAFAGALLPHLNARNVRHPPAGHHVRPAPPSSFPAAWYPDPNNGTLQRYWDGADWTNDTAPLG
jgi:hypothetical protein